MTSQTRRHFLRTALGAGAGSAILPSLTEAAVGHSTYSFVFLGDLHFDRLAHHNRAWLDKNKPGDLGQIQNYSRITADIMPALFRAVNESIDELQKSPAAKPAFILQAGDLVEGLCGTEELAVRQNEEAIAAVREANFNLPFLFTKGNHDVTGDGAPAAFAQVFHPFLDEQRQLIDPTAPPLANARYALHYQNAFLCFFDAYDPESLGWLEATLAERHEQHCFVVIHPPVVPYGARSTWHIFSNDRQKPQREKLLELLGKHEAFVLGGHIHKFNTLLRQDTHGRFLQFAMSSVVNAPEMEAKDILSGVYDYNGDQIKVEPNYSPETAEKRRAVYETERPFVRSFEYADLPGHAVVRVNGPQVIAEIYSATTRQLWRRVELSNLLRA